jgi:hypothetical protein
MSGTPEELAAIARSRRYRDFAAQMLRLAQTAHADEVKAAYLSLAQCWKNLAEQADRLASEFPDEPGQRERSADVSPADSLELHQPPRSSH